MSRNNAPSRMTDLARRRGLRPYPRLNRPGVGTIQAPMKCTIRFRNLPALNDAPTYYFSTGVADYDNITQAIVHGQRIAMTELIGVHSFIVEDENGRVRAEWARMNGEWKAVVAA
ncbi:hypothetical protein [Phenylobacterium sp.]|uniref:hypothetical protein n=1 Tax=Phenylobacterium sp. TaxID=1871053 RepID=UPI002730027C|nr:hypothetical protein [Phenylobacterium sp.]